MADNCYLEILATQRPFPLEVDENERSMFSVNFQAKSNQLCDDWERDVIRLLLNVGVAPVVVPVAGITFTFPLGNRQTDNTFIGAAAVIPTGSGPYVQVMDTGGAEPLETHDDGLQEQLSVQLLVRGSDYFEARDLALLCWRALDGVRDTTVSS